jgi:hypothetical protein
LIQDRTTKPQKPFLFFIAVFLTLITLPYIFAYFTAGSEYVFGGFLFNPIDGNSYLAKMYQGWSGEWQFTLPYTAEKGEGAYLFLFYLFLGHVSRIINLPLAVVFHIARVTGAIYLAVALAAFMKLFFANQPMLKRRAFLLAAFGSGIGWLAIPFGEFTADFWVAEAYPFLSAYATPHFSIGLALLLTIFLLSQQVCPFPTCLILSGLSLLLAVIQPFGIVVAIAVIAGKVIWDGWIDRRWTWQALLPVLIGGGLPLLYQFWIIQTDPLLSAWNDQNLTPAPALWDLVLSLSPAILIAFFALYQRRKSGDFQDLRLPIVWLIVGLLMIFFPFNLQRRFMLGIYIPTAILAVSSFSQIDWRRLRNSWAMLFAVSILTNIIILSAGVFGSAARDPAIFLTINEYRALTWVQMETDIDAVILASPEMGRFIPAYTGRRVLYGHPFETIEAKQREQMVLDYFSGELTLSEVMEVDYIFLGTRERLIGNDSNLPINAIMYQNEDVIIMKAETP